MGAFSRDLKRVGWLHNHARMWLATTKQWSTGIVCAGRHVPAGFSNIFFDGDPVSNNLSWQWVTSALSHKP